MISVVVPVGRVDEQLFEQLRALDRQASAPQFEVVLSANAPGSSLELSDIRASFPLTVIDSSDLPGPSHARNAGWRAASGSIVLFCDADDVVDDRWIAEMAQLSQGSEIFGGRLEYELLNPPGVGRWIHNWSEGMPRKFAHLPFLPSANIGMSRQLLERLGGWNESLSASEDTDLCWRAQKLGYDIGYSSKSLVHYRLRPNWWDTFKQHMAYGVSDVTFARQWGLSTKPLASLIDTGRTLLFCGVAIVDRSRRPLAAAKLGVLLGRLRQSRRLRWWCV